LGVGGKNQNVASGAASVPKHPTPNIQPPTRPAWPLPHAIAGEVVATDEKFEADGLRVQSAQKRDAAKVRDEVKAILDELRVWLAASDVPAARALAADFHPPPLNLVIVPQKMIDDGALFPELPTPPGASFAYRYIDKKRTLFMNDTKGFERQDLADGVATHVLTWVPSLTNAQVAELPEKFAEHYKSKSK
jgi:hypothetical protein